MTNVIEKFSRNMKIRNLSPATQQNYHYAVNRLAKYYLETRLEDLTDDQIQDYIHYLIVDREYSPRHVGVQVAGIRFFYCWAVRKDLRKFLIPIPKQHKTLPEILSRQEVGRLFQEIAYDLRKTAYFQILYGCGLRGSEACNLRMAHIDRERKTLWVRKGKGGKDRGVYLPKVVYQALAHYWRASHFTDYLFVKSGAPDQPMDISTARGWLRTIKKEIGVKKSGGLHMLRHSYATHALEDGMHPLTIQKNLGHTSLRTTEIYLKLAQIPDPQMSPIERLFQSKNRPENQKS